MLITKYARLPSKLSLGPSETLADGPEPPYAELNLSQAL